MLFDRLLGKKSSRRAARVQKQSTRSQYRRRLLAETLEERRVMAINVAVVGDTFGNDQAGFVAIRDQLNNDTHFDFSATLVNQANVDTVAELTPYDVVVIGNDGYANTFTDAFSLALRDWVQNNGGGVVMTGWGIYNTGWASAPARSALDAVIPVNLMGGYGSTSSLSLDVLNDIHPVSRGVVDTNVSGVYAEYPSGGVVDAGSHVLARVNNQPVAVAGTFSRGHGVYLGPIYSGYSGYDTASLRSGEFDQLLEQAVAWAGGRVTVVPVTPNPRATDVSTVDVEFDAAIAGATFSYQDIELYRDGVAIPLDASVSTSLVSGNRYRISGLAPFTAADGTYAIVVHGVGITAGGQPVPGSDYASWVKDVVAPSLIDIVDVTDPRNTAVASVDVLFDEPIDLSTFTYQDLSLTRNGGANLITPAVTISYVSGNQYRINNLSSLTNVNGDYLLTVNASFTDQAGNAATGMLTEAWSADLTLPQVTATTPAHGGNAISPNISSMTVTFSEPVTIASAEEPDNYYLQGPNGSRVNVSTVVLDPSRTVATLTFPAQTTGGSYSLRVGNIRDDAGNIMPAVVSFNPIPSVYNSTVGTFVHGQTVGDFNGDTYPDLVVTSYNDNRRLIFFPGQAGGGFGTSVILASQFNGYSQQLISAHLDGDGFLDLISTNGGQVGVLFGNGNGTFQPLVVGGSAHSAYAVEVGRVNADGLLDLVIAGNGSYVTTLLNNGTRNLSSWSRIDSNVGPANIDFALADINADGKLDYVSHNYQTGYVGLGNGLGSFSYSNTFPVQPYGDEHVAVVDLDQDGALDFVNGAQGTYVTYGTGTTFPFLQSSPQNLGSNFNNHAVSVHAIDLDGDGDLDLTKGSWFTSPSGIFISYNRGNRVFTNQTFDLSGYGYSFGGSWNLSFADVNGDGFSDILSAPQQNNRLYVLKSQLAAPVATFTLISATDVVSISGGELLLSDGYPGGRSSNVTLTADPANNRLVLTDPGAMFGSATAIAGITFSPDRQSMYVSTTGTPAFNRIRVEGGLGSDTLTIDLTGGNPIPAGGITFNGGENSGDDDRLKITGTATVASAAVNHTGAEAGSVVLSGLGTITFNQIEPLFLDVPTADLTITLPAGPNSATLGDDGVAPWDGVNDANKSAIYGATFEYTEFTNPTNSLTVLRGDAADTLTVLNLVVSGMGAGLTIGTSSDRFSQVTFSGPITLSADKSLAAFAASLISLPNAASDLAVSGAATLSLNSEGHITLLDGASVTTQAGANSLIADSNQNGSGVITLAGTAAIYGAVIDLHGTDLDIANTANIGGSISSLSVATQVTARPSTLSRQINLGTTTAGSLSLTAAELNRFFTDLLQVGDAASGLITISAAIAPANTSTLKLVTGGGVTQASNSAKTTIANLAVSAAGAVAMNLGSGSGNSVTTFAATGSSVGFNDANGFTVGSVAGVSGVIGTTGGVGLRADGGPITINDVVVGADVSGATGLGISLWGDDQLLTIASGAGVQGGASGVSLHAQKADIQGTVVSGGTLDFSSGNDDEIRLGSTVDTTADTLELSDAELDNMSAASLISIGSGSLNRDIVITADLTLDAKTLRLYNNGLGSVIFSGGSLTTTSDVTINTDIVADAAGVDITANKLIASGTAGSSTNPLRTELANISIHNASAIYVVESTGVALTNNGLQSAGNIRLEAGGTISTSADAVANGTLEFLGNALTLNSDTLAGSAVSVTANVMSISASGIITAGANTVTLKPRTAGRAIHLGAEDAAKLSLTDTELDRVTAGTIVIGDGNNGTITFGGNIDRAAATNLILTAGVDTNIALGAYSLNAGTGGDISLTTSGTGAITTSDNLGNDLVGDAIVLAAGSGGIANSANRLRMDANTMAASTTGNGSIYLQEANTVNVVAGGLSAGTGTVALHGGTFALTTGQISAYRAEVYGTLRLDAAGLVNDTVWVMLFGTGIFDLNGFSETIGPFSSNGGTEVKLGSGTFTINVLHGTSSSGLISGSGNWTLQGTGEYSVSSNNTYSGTTTIAGPQVNIGHANSLGSTAGGTIINSGMLLLSNSGQTYNEPLVLNAIGGRGYGILENYGGNNTWAGPITLAVSSNIGTTFNGNNLNVTGPIDGVGGLLIQGQSGAKVTLSGANSYDGLTNVNSGAILILGNAAALGTSASGINVNSGATLDLAGFSTSDPLQLSGTGAPGYNGALVNTSGTPATASGAVLLTGHTTLAGAGDFTLSGVIDDGANTYSLTKVGLGTVTLTNANTYNGPTLVNAGTLKVNGSLSTTSDVTAQTAGTISGTGTIRNVLSGNSGGTIAPGDAGAGTLTVNRPGLQGLVMVSNSNLDLQIAGSGSYDKLAINGAVSIGGGKLNFSTLSYTPQAGDQFIFLENDGTDAILGTFVAGAGSSLVSGTNLPEGTVISTNFFGSGLPAVITYQGGTGNDAAILVGNTNVALNSGNLTITDVIPAGKADDIRLKWTTYLGNDYLEIHDPVNYPAALGIVGAVQFDAHTLYVPLASITGSITVDTLAGNDRLTTSFVGGNFLPVGGLAFHGGENAGDDDELVVIGNGTHNARYTPSATTFGDGAVVVDGTRTISFTGLEPVDITGMATVTVASPANAANTLSVSGGFDAATGLIPALVVTGDTGLAPLQIESAHLYNNGTVILDTSATIGAGANSITISGAVPLGHNNTNLTLLTTASGSVTVSAAAAVSGTMSVQAPTVYLNADLVAAVFTGTATTVNVDDAPSGQIQDAVNIAASGATIQVAAGTFAENVILNKSLNLLGAKAGVDARGRVVGAPNPAVETVISPASGRSIELQELADDTTIDGLAIIGNISGATGAIESTGATDRLNLLNNHVAIAVGFTASALFLNRNAIDSDFDKNEFVAAAGSTQAVFFDGPDSFHGLHFTNNNILRSGGISGTGFFVDGNRNIGISGSLRSPLVQGNRFEGHALGFNAGQRSFADTQFVENSFIANTGGFAGGPLNSTIEQNTFSNNALYGLRLTAFGNTADSTRGAQNTVVQQNVFTNNGTTVDLVNGYGDIRIDDQFNGTQSTNTIVNNHLGSSAVGIFNRETNPEVINASGNWWGTVAEAAVQAKILGVAAANVDFTHYLHNAADTSGTAGFQGDFSDLHVTALGAQSGVVGRVQEAINAVTSGGRVRIHAGTYTGGADAVSGGKDITLAPGNSPAQVLLIGNLSLNPGDILEIEIDGTSSLTQYDNFIVTGTVDITGATLAMSGSYIPNATDTFTLIANDLADVSGPFALLPAGSIVNVNGTDLRIFYTGNDGNDIVLMPLTPTTVYVENSWAGMTTGDFILDADFGLAGNQSAIFNYNAFSTITNAQTAVAAGGLIVVRDGTYAEAVVLAGSLAMRLTGNSELGTGTVTVNSIAGTSTNPLALGSTVAAHLTTGSGASTTYAGVISGPGGITKVGSSTWELSGANAFDGAVSISTGSILVSHNSALGSTGGATSVADNTAWLRLSNGITVTGEALTIAGDGDDNASFSGALQAAGGASATWAGTVSLGNLARVGALTGGTLTISGVIQDGGGNALFVSGQTGTGAVVIAGTSNTYTGATNIIRGKLSIGAANALPLGTTLDVDVSSAAETATFDLNGFHQTVGGLQRTNAGGGSGGSVVTNSSVTPATFTVNQAVNTSYSGTISNNLSFVKQGTGTLTLSGANTYTGATIIENGQVTVAGGNNRLPVGTTVTLGAGTTSGVLQLGDGVAASNQTLAGLLKAGTGTANAVVGGNASVSTLTLNIAGTNAYTGVLGGAAANQNNLALTKTGVGTLTLSTANTYSGGTVLSQGTLQVDHGSALGGGLVTINDANTGANNTSLLAGTAVTINNGLSVANQGSGVTTIGTTDFTVSANTQFGGTLTLAKDVTLQAGSTDRTTFAGQITGTGNLQVTSPFAASRRIVLDRPSGGPANNFAGNVTLATNAQLQLGVATTVGNNLITDTASITFNTGSLLSIAPANAVDGETVGALISVAQGNGTISKGFGSQAFTLTIGSGNGSGTYSGAISNSAGSLGITKTGTGAQTIRGNTSTLNNASGLLRVADGTLNLGPGFTGDGAWQGNVQVDSGKTLNLMQSNILHNASDVTVNGTFNMGGQMDAIGNLAGSGNVTNSGGITLDDLAVNANFSGVISGSGGLTLRGNQTNGSQTLSGANTYTGATAINVGNLILTGSLGSVGTPAGNVSIASGAILSGSGTANANVSGVAGSSITATGNLTLGLAASATGVATSGALTVGANNVTLRDADAAVLNGTTSISAGGTLGAANGIQVGGNLTTVGTDTANISGNVTTTSGATVTPGGAGTGILSIAGNLSLVSGATLTANINGATAGTQYDQVAVSGSTSITGATLTPQGGFSPVAGTVITLINTAPAGTITGAFVNYAEGSTLTVGAFSGVVTYAGGLNANDATVTVLGPVSTNGTAGADDFELRRRTGGGIDNIELLLGGVVIDSRPYSTVTNWTINGLGGNDTLNVNFSYTGGIFDKDVFFVGGADTNSLTITGGAFGAIIHDYTGAASGTVRNYTDAAATTLRSTITYSEQVSVVDTSTATNMTFNLPATNDQAAVEDLGAGMTRLRSTSGPVTFAQTSFVTPAAFGQVTITGGAGDDTVTITSLASPIAPSLMIDGGANNDQVVVNTNLSIGGNINFTAENIALNNAANTSGGNITLSGNVQLGTASNVVSLTTSGGSVSASGTVTSTVAGQTGLAVNATGGAVSFGSAVGTLLNPLRSLSISTSGITTLGDDIRTDSGVLGGTGNVSFSGGGAIALGASLVIDTEQGNNGNGGTVDFGTSSVSAAAASRNLTINTLATGFTAGNVLNLASNTALGFAINILSVDGGNITTNAITTAGTIDFFARDAVTLNGLMDAGSATIAIAANQDLLGSESFTQNLTGDITTANASTVAVVIEVGGSGNANVRSISTGVGTPASVTIEVGGAVTDLNASATNINTSNLIVSAATGIDLDTNITNLTASNTTSGDVQIDETNGINLTSLVNSGGNARVHVAAGNITQSGAMNVSGNVNVQTPNPGSGNVVLFHASNQIGGQVILVAGGNAQLQDTLGHLVFAQASVGGNLVVQSTGGDIQQTGALLTIGGTSSLTTTLLNADIVLDSLPSPNNDFVGAVSLFTNGPTAHASIEDRNTLNIGTSNVGGNLLAVAEAGDLVSSGTATVGGTATFRSLTAAIVDSNSTVVNVVANNFTGTAVTGIGAAADRFEVQVVSADLSVSSAGVINVQDLAGGMTVNTATTFNGDIILQAIGGDLTLTSVTAGGGGDVDASTVTNGNIALGAVAAVSDLVTLVAAGAITDANGTSPNISADRAELRAASGVGSADAIETSLALLAAVNSGANDIRIDNASGALLTLTTVGATNGVNNNGAGAVDIANNGGITVAQNSSAGAGGFALTARESAASGEDIVVNTLVTVQSDGYIDFNAGDNFTIPAGATLVAGDDVTLDSLDGTDAGGSTYNFFGDVDADAARFNGANESDTFNIKIDDDTMMYVDGNLPPAGTLPGDQLNVFGLNMTLTLNGIGAGTWTGPGIVGLDYVEIETVTSDNPYHLVVNLRATGFLSSNSLDAQLDTTNTELELRVDTDDDARDGTLAFNGAINNIRSLTVLGSADAEAFSITQNANNLLPGDKTLPLGTRGLNDAHPTYGQALNSSFLGDGRTPANSPASINFRGEGNAVGTNDLLRVNLNLAENLGYYADNTGTVGSGNINVQGKMTVAFNGSERVDFNQAVAGGSIVIDSSSFDALANLTVTDLGSATQVDGDNGFADVEFNNAATVLIRSGLGAETINVVGINASGLTTLTVDADNRLSTDTADDTIQLQSLPAGAQAFLYGGTGRDTFRLHNIGNTVDLIAGKVTVDGQDGNGAVLANDNDQLIVVDSGSSTAATVTVTETTIQGLTAFTGAGAITYANIDRLDVTATSGADTITIDMDQGISDLNTATVRGSEGQDQFFMAGVENYVTTANLQKFTELFLFGDGTDSPSLGDFFGTTANRFRPSKTVVININGGTPSPVGPPMNVAGDRLNLTMAVGGSPQTAVTATTTIPVLVDTVGGTATSASHAAIKFADIEWVDLVDLDGQTNTQRGDLYVRASEGADRIILYPDINLATQKTVRLRYNNADIGPLQQVNASVTSPGKFIVYGRNGNDQISVNNTLLRDSELYGQLGNDYLVGSTGGGVDLLVGGSGADRLQGLAGNDILWGDKRPGAPETPTDTGTDNGADQLNGGAGNDLLDGGGGNDKAYGEDGNDIVRGGLGDDTITGDKGDDIVIGGDGKDKANGGYGRDLVIGGRGVDTVDGDQEQDIVIGDRSIWDDNSAANDAALQAIMFGPAALGGEYWANTDLASTYAARTTNTLLRSAIFGNLSSNLFDDTAIDSLVGDLDLDWYIDIFTVGQATTIDKYTGRTAATEKLN